MCTTRDSGTAKKGKLWYFLPCEKHFCLCSPHHRPRMAWQMSWDPARTEGKLMSFIKAFFLPSEHPMSAAHRSICRVPTASPTAISYIAITQTPVVLLGCETMSGVNYKWTGSPQQHLHHIPIKNHLHSQSKKSCVKTFKGRYRNPTEKLVGNYSLNTSTCSANASLAFSVMYDLKVHLWQ